MSKLTWDASGQRFFENGVDHGVLYIPNDLGVYDNGVAWNGLTTVTESPTGGEATKQYADNLIYATLYSIEELEGTIEAFTYPDEWGDCDGTSSPEPGVSVGQQTRKSFGLCYRTKVGNDLNPDLGFKLHLIYGATASPSEKAYATVNDSPEMIDFSWKFYTVPHAVTGLKPTSSIVIDSTKVDADALAALEDFLYGTVSDDPRLPTPDEVLALFAGTITSVTPTAPTYDSGTDLVTIPSVTGVIYMLNGVVVSSGTYPITANAVAKAVPAAGYVFPATAQDQWWFTFA